MRYFMTDDSEYIETLDCFKEELIEDDLEEMKLFETERDIGGPMWCISKEDFVEKGVDCGGFCKHYSPCNGKSGRCRDLKNGYVLTGKKFLLTKEGLKEIINEKFNEAKTGR